MAFPNKELVLSKENFNEILSSLETLISKGGPDEGDYKDITKVCDQLMNAKLTVTEESQFHDTIKPLMSLDSMLGFSFLKPHGYAGDHELIDRIYQEWHSSDAEFNKWDKYYHYLDAPQAVRNRKEYLKNELVKLTSNDKQSTVLNLASGPCTDLYEFLISHPGSNIKYDCLDLDAKALEYGAAVCDAYYERIQYIHKNAFRYSTETRYDLIWSAGLFDYFSDKLFVRLVNRMYALLAEDGELVVGNFSPYNTSRGVQELVCQWYLHHRSENELIELALKGGVPRSKISVDAEDTGVNLFLHLKK